MPKISVVISLYNKERYIKRCLDSVLNQTFTDFEVIVVDDASTDNSVQVIKDNFNDKRIKIISRENGGPAAARNTGIKAAKGEWIVFLDADDAFLPWALLCFVDLLKNKSGHQYYICNYYMGSDDEYTLFTNKKSDKLITSPFKWEYLEWLSDRPGSAMYKRELLLRNLFNEKLRRFEDAESQYCILNQVQPYQSSTPVMISFRDASEAANYRKDINEDFVGHLVFEGKSFWEKMQLYKLANGAVNGYGMQIVELYGKTLSRFDYKLLNRLVNLFRRISNRLNNRKYTLSEIYKKNYANNI